MWTLKKVCLSALNNCNPSLASVGGRVTPGCRSAAVPLTHWLGALRSLGSNPLFIPQSCFSSLVFQGSSGELFGEMFQNLPRLSSDFLNPSWQTSRNIPTPKTLSMDFTPPTSSPKPRSEATLSPPLSPRSAVLSSKPSSPRSHSSNSFQKKSFKSKSKELPSPLLSPKSISKSYTPSPQRTPRKRVATTKKALTEESPLRPKEPSRPSSEVSHKDLSEEEHPASPQTGINL